MQFSPVNIVLLALLAVCNLFFTASASPITSEIAERNLSSRSYPVQTIINMCYETDEEWCVVTTLVYGTSKNQPVDIFLFSSYCDLIGWAPGVNLNEDYAMTSQLPWTLDFEAPFWAGAVFKYAGGEYFLGDQYYNHLTDGTEVLCSDTKFQCVKS